MKPFINWTAFLLGKVCLSKKVYYLCNSIGAKDALFYSLNR